MHNYQSTSVLSSSDYSVIPPVEWNDNQLEQLILEAKSNSNASYLLLLDGGEDRLSSSTIPATTSTIDDNNDNNNASSRSERHPSTSSKVIADEVEMLFEVIQENELESSSHTITAGCGGEIGGGNGDGGGDIGTGTIIVDGDNSYRNEINWQNDAKAVARICEQLQQGLVSNNNNSNNNNHNITTITTTSELSGYSSNNSIINNSSSTSATATSADALSEYGSISRSNNNNYMKMSSKHGYTEIHIKFHTSPFTFVAMPINPLLVTTRTTWSSFPPQTTSTVQRRFSGGSSGGGGVNKAAVAAALASQQAAASQRNQLTNQRLLAEQRKRLIQHQLYNQVAVYSLNSPSNNYNSPYEGGGGTGNIDPYHQGNTFILNENIPHGIESIPVIVTAVPVASNTITNITTATTVTPPLSYVIPSHKSITRRRRSLCLDGSGCGGGGGGGQNFNSGVLSLNATTVHSSTNSASISTASKISGFYHPHHHRPEDLSRCLKEVGPNVRVELSCKIPVNENHHHSSNMNKMPHVYSATSIDSNNNNSNNCTISIGNATKMLQQSSKSLQQHHQQPRNHHLGPTITSTTTTTPGSIFHNPDPIIQSSSSNANNPNSSSKGHPSTSVYCTPSTVVVLVPSAAGAGSSMNSLRMTSRNQISPENQQHLSIVDNSRLVKAELRQALVGRQVIYQNSINNNNNTTTNNNNVIDNNRRGYQCSQVLLPPSNQFTDSLPSSMMNMYHTTSCYTSSSVLGVDQFSNSSILPCSTTTMGTTSTIHRTPPPPPPTTTMTRGVIPSTMRGYDHHNPNQIVSGVQNSMSNVNNNNNNNNCQQWSPTVLPQSVYIRQGSLNLDINTTNSNNNNSSNNNISTSYNVYPSQSIHLIHDDNGGDPFDFLNYNSNNNNSSYFNNTFSYPSVHPLTPSSLSPISVSANTSPCSSTTSQTALLKSPICQPGGGGGGEFLHTSESSISSSSFIMNNHLSNNNSNYYYESNPLGVSYDAVATTIAATSSSCYLSNNHSNYTSTTTAPLPTTTITATPVMPKSSSSSSSLSVAASTNSTTLVYNLTRDPLDFQLSTSTSLGVVNHHLETMMLQSDFRNHQQQQQQQQEENLLPDDLINDVFDLEIMIAAKHQQQQHPNETPFTSSDEFDFLTNATTLEEEEGDNRHPRQHCCYSPTTSIHNTFKMSLSPDTTTSSSTSTALPTSGALSNSVVANQCTVTR
uniref:Uncharacterized protein n=1 Tax=Trichobilharzia regenti TaxID=157069 RepID=A0AA85JM62_TRIRE|nr:unnamed protein product [Trichobilharzia regenti]